MRRTLVPSTKRPIRSDRRGRMAGVALAVTLGAVTVPIGAASAQTAANCSDVQKILLDRRSISDRLQSGGKKKIDARFACGEFGKLVNNGQTLIKWVDANKDWCQIPDTFVQGIKADHTRAISIRGQACNVAAKQTEMEKRAREGGGNGGGGLLGGNGLTGDVRMPQGAL